MMKFIDSYKRLEKLCNEMYNDNHGLSLYIDELAKISNKNLSFSQDLKRLKHYRWIRNQIVHEPGCTEENMCNSDDVRYIEDFYFKILNSTDPLSLYYKATQQTKTPNKPSPATKNEMYSNRKTKIGCLSLVVGCLLGIIAIILILNIV